MSVLEITRADFFAEPQCLCDLCEPERSILTLAAPPRASGACPRAVHLIDLENLVGSAAAPTCLVRRAWAQYQRIARPGPADQLVIGLCPFAAGKYMTAIPLTRLRLVLGGAGPNSADLALIEAADPEHLARRFQTVFIASGDGIFTELAEDLIARGLEVCNVTSSLAGSSRRLAGACTRGIRLDLGLPATGEVA